MAKEKIVVGVDIGSTKICTVIASVSPEGQVSVIGVSSITSRGLRKSQVVDIEETVSAITESLESAERMAGYSIGTAVVSVGGTHVECQNSKGVVAVSQPQAEINPEDVRRVTEAARAISLPSSREIIHVLPRYFIVDAQPGIKDPVGMTGVRLEVETHIVTGAATAMRNLAKCVQEVGVDVSGLVFSGLASAQAVLSETERELGVVLVDFGGGSTSICIFVEGALSHSAVLPVGAKNITNDLAIGLRVSLETAEKIKLFLSKPPKLAVEPKENEEDNSEKKKKEEDLLDLKSLGVEEEIKSVSRKTLVEGIIRPRLIEILNIIKIEIQKSGFGGMTPAGIVLTGGGAQTQGIVELAKRELAMPVRIGFPTGATGLVDEVSTPPYATSLGLALYAAQEEYEGESRLPLVGRVEVKGLVSKGLEWFRSLLP